MNRYLSIQRFENEDFLSYAERLLKNRQDYDLDKVEIYELLYGEQVSPDHARKCLANLERTIEECKKYNWDKQTHKEFNDKDLEIDLLTKKSIIELHKDGSQTSERLILMCNENAKNPDFLLIAHGYDPQCWELVSARNNIWQVYSKQDGIQALYSSKIVVKPRTEYRWNAEEIQKLFDSLKTDYKNKINVTPLNYSENGYMLALPIADFHYNLVADEFSTGNDYNVEIAEQVYYYALNDVISRVKHRKFEKILFVVGNDFINADNINGTTTKGTVQDNNTLWFSTITKVTQLIINGADMLTEIAPVDILYVPSNHDLHSMFGIMQTIKAWYRNDEYVTVDNSPLFRKYYRFGNTLLNFSHDMKTKDALEIVTTEAKQHWSDCTHIISMLAHLHQEMEYAKQGYLEVRRLPTISGWSRWSNNSGYVQSEKKNQAFIIHKDKGITDILNTVLSNITKKTPTSSGGR